MAINTIEIKPSKTNHTELYRELESINALQRMRSARSTKSESFYQIAKWTHIFRKKKVYGTQCEVFQAAMALVVISGQLVGLVPFVGVLEKEASRIRYTKHSMRFVYSSLMCVVQSVALLLSLFRLLTHSISVSKLGYFSFYAATCLTSIVFLRLASKWRHLMEQISSASLDEYIDSSVRAKCNLTTVILLTFAILEHILSIISEVSEVRACNSPEQDIHRLFIEATFPWLFDIGVTYSVFLGIVLPIINLASTIIWSYSHMFIVCISYFLASILEEINKKVKSQQYEYLPSSCWRKLREDYSRATQLVREFDEFINDIVFASFASNLFFVCLRLYNILAFGIKTSKKVVGDKCLYYDQGIFHGYEVLTYLSFSLVFVIVRSLAVSLVAARVHSASLIPATYLYNVPSPAYCTEVERFIEQVHGDNIALSGLNFFYVTKELVLSVAGTIVTYELVLLQFNG